VAALELPVVTPDAEPSWHLYVIRVRDAARRAAGFAALRAAGLGVQVHYEPVHLHPWFRDRGHGPGDFPLAEDYAARAVSLPMFPRMSDEDVDRAITTVRDVAKQVL
jgi:dTDP-4-amino-4,6-dideoxygalactose transaminase